MCYAVLKCVRQFYSVVQISGNVKYIYSYNFTQVYYFANFRRFYIFNLSYLYTWLLIMEEYQGHNSIQIVYVLFALTDSAF